MMTLLVWVAAAALAHDGGVFPARQDAPADWAITEGFAVAAPAVADGGGSRVAAYLELVHADAPVRLQARGERAGAVGPWVDLEVTWALGDARVAVADLDGTWDAARLRAEPDAAAAIATVRWEIVEPAYPDAGRLSRELAADGVRMPLTLDAHLTHVGVVARASWGARPTTCSSTEDDWYRMAVHHTAGSQTSGGTVAGAVAATQAYAMDSGVYCDIPYQFMVGYDGTLYEGRELTYQSGATGGNNDGNIAMCFLGCYHPSDCPAGAGDLATDEMLWGGRLLAQTLVELHAIPSDRNSIRGHQEWPDNATACPGDYVMARLDEITWDLPWYAASLSSSSVPLAGEGTVDLAPGESATVTFELVNTGGLPWIAGETKLGTTEPRDADSPLADGSWLAGNRAATVASDVPPGGTGAFTFTVTGDEPGEVVQHLGLVHEGWTWFADAPWGGGPSDTTLALDVVVTEDGTPQDSGDTAIVDSGDPDSGDPGGPGGPGPGGQDDDGPPGVHPDVDSLVGTRSKVGGCGCAGGPAGGAASGMAALVALALTRRRRAPRPQAGPPRSSA